MKKIFTILFSLLLFTNSFSQVAPPEAFNYQAVARDNSGNILVSQSVSFRMSILKTTVNGTVVYSEAHILTTDAYGLANLAIGAGTVLSGVFANIDWAADSYFFKTEFDQNGGNSFQLMGTSQLLSVPYALHAKTVSGISDPLFPDGTDGISVFLNGSYTVPSGKNLIITTSTGPHTVITALNPPNLEVIYTPEVIILIGNDTLWGSWNFIPENTSITVITQNNESVTGLLFDKKTSFVSMSTQTNYLVPAGKKLYLYLPSWSPLTDDNNCEDIIPGRFRIDGNNYINSPTLFSDYSAETEEMKLLILQSGSTIEYVDYNLNNFYCPAIGGPYSINPLPRRVFTGYLK